MSKIIWKGIDSETIPGLLITKIPPISKPKMKTAITKIDGRDGDVVEELGYEAYTKSIGIGLTRNYDIDQVIKYFTGMGALTISNEPNKYYIARIFDKIDYEKLLRFKTATIKFYVQPYKYLKNESLVDLNITSQTSAVVENKGLEKSKPIITLEGSGTVVLSLNGRNQFTYTFPEGETEVTIDSTDEEAYLYDEFKNRNMQGSFINLNPGNNTISWTGSLTRITIEPRSRWL